MSQDYVSIQDLGLAYRKAKVDLFISYNARNYDLSLYESQLLTNLKKLKKDLDIALNAELNEELFNEFYDWLLNDSVDQPWVLVPKSIHPKEDCFQIENIKSEPEAIYTDPNMKWKNSGKEWQADFRLMENLPIKFHVFANVWMFKIGEKLERLLSSSARGNRLHRDRNGAFNRTSHGSTKYYSRAYQKWRDEALSSVRHAANSNEKVIVISTDIQSFYHNVDLDFLIEFIGYEPILDQLSWLSDEDFCLHYLFVNSLKRWAASTPLGTGLPVGLTASSVIANLSLIELDDLIKKQLNPIYYGRYVDDILLAFQNTSDFTSTKQVWSFLKNNIRSDTAAIVEKDGFYTFQADYLASSKLLFSEKKSKVFFFNGKSGTHLIDSIQQAINERSSEWRLLPNWPDDPDEQEANIIEAIQSDGLPSGGLQNAEQISVRRARFATQLRDIEFYSRVLPPEAWQARRHVFVETFISHILVLPTFFEFNRYFSRVLSLTIQSRDLSLFKRILSRLSLLLKELNRCELRIASSKSEHKKRDIVDQVKRSLQKTIRDAVYCSLCNPRASDMADLQQVFLQFDFLNNILTTSKEDLSRIKAIRSHDLANLSLRKLLLDDTVKFTKKKRQNISQCLPNEIMEALDSLELKFSTKTLFPSGLAFPTRPFTLRELYFTIRNPFTENGARKIDTIMFAFRGYHPEHLPILENNILPFDESALKCEDITVAVTSWLVSDQSWEASVVQAQDPDVHRVDRLMDLINSVIKARNVPNYLILPELAIPQHLFHEIDNRLQHTKISLISGVEYTHPSKSTVSNQVWGSLHRESKYPPRSYLIQEKVRPAQHEEQHLFNVGGRSFHNVPNNSSPYPMIFKHCGIYFAILICSELTNIDYRSSLRGKIDLLFVPEWNQDTGSFDALVESSALDIHAYIVQCNNRQYGDSRIRSPSKDLWDRDIVRVRGGIDDYFVTGKLNIGALRNFQSYHRSPDGPFKPVPDGFKIAEYRRELPNPRKKF